jgi:hypothetical protein
MRGTPRCSVYPRGYSSASDAGGVHSHAHRVLPKAKHVGFGSETGQPVAALTKMPHNFRMHLTGYSGLRPLPPAGDAGR